MIGTALLLLSSCSILPSVPFPVTLPSQRVIDAEFQTIRHNLSPLPSYHFEVTLPKDWQSLDTRIFDEPAEDIPVEVGAFRQPGAWSTDSRAPTGAEVAVSVVRPSQRMTGSDAGAWLEKNLKQTVPGHRILQQRMVKGNPLEWADVLVRYSSAGQKIIARFRVQSTLDHKRVFIVTASAPADQYADIAEGLFVAVESFRPLSGQ